MFAPLWVLLTGLAAQTPPTTITATPASLTFQYQQGAAARLPAAQTVALKTNVASLTATVSVSGDLPSNGDWLEPSVRRGTSLKLPGSLTVTVTPTSLAAGTYGAVITLSAVDSGGNPVTQTVPVILVVSAPPSQLDFSPAGLTFNYTTGGTAPTSQQFLMYSEGGPVSATVAVSGTPWLKVAPSGSVQVGGLFKPITVSIDPEELAKLAPKVYTTNISVSAPAALNKTTSYPITLNVNAAVPAITDTWPAGVVLSGAGTGTTTVVLDGTGFFDTSTVAATGFTSSSAITVTDSTSGTPLSTTEIVSIPVYAAAAGFLRLTLGSPLPTAFVGSAYSKDLASFVAGGTGPYTWSATGLTGSGLTLSSAGLLAGTTPVAGNYEVVITVTDAHGSRAYMPLSLTIRGTATPPAGTVWITVGSVLPAAAVGTAYTATVAVAGGSGPFSWSVDSSTPLAAGLSIAAAGTTPAISGTPTSVGATGSLTSKRLSEGALQVTLPNTYLAKQGIVRMAVHTPAPGGGDSNEAQFQVYGPEPRVLAVVNAASYAAGAVAPGELISIFGTGLGPATLDVYDPNASPLPTTLPAPAPPEGVTSVQFTDGVTTWNAPLIYTSATQVGAMVPFEVASAGSVTMTLSYGAAGAVLTSKPFPLTIATAVPGIFTADGSGRGQGAILNYIAATNDYTINSGSNPALLRNTPIVVLYLTGFGVTNPASSSTLPAGSGVDSAAAVTVTIDGKAASPVVTGVPAGSFPGLLQVNVTAPSDATPGKTVPVSVSVGGVAAQSGVTMGLK